MPRGRFALLGILVLALALRLAFFAVERPWDEPVENGLVLAGDARGYHMMARTLLATGEFTYEPGDPPDALRTPGYPGFIAAIYAVFGAHPWIVLLFQILLDVAACALLYRLVSAAFGAAAGGWGALLYAVDPFLILQANLLLSETLCVFLLTVGTIFLVLGLRHPGPRVRLAFLALSGCAFGHAAMTRPILQFAPLVVFLTFVLGRRTEPRLTLKLVGAFTLGFVLLLTPWLLRNQQTFGTAALSTSGAYNLLVLDVAPAVASARGEDPRATTAKLLDEARASVPNPDGGTVPEDFELARAWQRTALSYAARYPGAVARHYVLGIVHAFVNLGTSSFSQALRLNRAREAFAMKSYDDLGALGSAWARTKSPAEKAVGALVALELFVVYAAMAYGIVLATIKRRAGTFTILCLLFVAYVILLTGSAGDARLRLPAVPFYLPFAGLGAAALVSRIRTRATA